MKQHVEPRLQPAQLVSAEPDPLNGRLVGDSDSGAFMTSRTMRSECRYGSGFRSTALTVLKIAVVAPTPRATVRIATIEKSGVRTNERHA
jgi:hypothetical protein